MAQTSVSAWLAEAARDRLRLEALGQAVATWEQELGPLTEAEIARADRLLQHETKRRSGRGLGGPSPRHRRADRLQLGATAMWQPW